MSKKCVKNKYFFITTTAIFAFLLVFPTISAKVPYGTFNVIDASFNNFFVSNNDLTINSQELNLVVGDAFEVTNQSLLKGFHQTNNSFGYEFSKSNSNRDFTFAGSSNYFAHAPEYSLIGNALSVSPQIIKNGWHLRNHVFFVEWENRNNHGLFNIIPAQNLIDFDFVYVKPFHEITIDPNSLIMGDALEIFSPQFFFNGWHNRNTSFKSNILKFGFVNVISSVQKEAFITDEQGQPMANVQIDVLDENSSIESQSFTDENGYAIIEFAHPELEYTSKIFKVLYTTHKSVFVPIFYNTLSVSMQPISSNEWVNDNWSYVLPITITPQKDITECIANETIDLKSEMIKMNSFTSYVDENSIRVIEVDSNGNIISEANTNVK